MPFAIVECGFIGQKRAAAISKLGHLTVLVVDRSRDHVVEFADRFGARAATDFRAAVEAADIDAVVVATTHKEISAIAKARLDAGKHVLVENPGGRNLAEVSAVRGSGGRRWRVAKVGYNHRFHTIVLKARAIVDLGELGQLMFMRGPYGHGGRPGDEKEWRLQRSMWGHRELIDKGSHFIDLAQWLLGEFTDVQAVLRTFFWNAEVEDNVVPHPRRRPKGESHGSMTVIERVYQGA